MEYKGVNYIFVRQDKKILLQKRDNIEAIKFPGEYCFPGGHVEKGEDILETVIREIKEEVELDLKPGDLKHIFDNIHTWGDVSAIFFCKFNYQPKIASNEGTMEWKTIEEIKNIKLVDNQNKMLEKIAQEIEGSK